VELWQRRLIVIAVVVVAGLLLAWLVDKRMRRQKLAPAAATRYRVLRRAVTTGIVFVAVLSALLVIPQVRAVAGGVLASSAVLGIIIGFAAQRTLGNFVAGILIAFAQPLRLGDRVAVAEGEGIVEEIGLTFTVIRCDDNTRLVIPNETLASDTIRNSTIVSREKVAQITVQVPLQTDLTEVLDVLRKQQVAGRVPEAFLSSLDGGATITVRVLGETEEAAEELEAELRLSVHDTLRTHGLWAAA
jgi:small-conductance mechanosensitive channel